MNEIGPNSIILDAHMASNLHEEIMVRTSDTRVCLYIYIYICIHKFSLANVPKESLIDMYIHVFTPAEKPRTNTILHIHQLQAEF